MDSPRIGMNPPNLVDLWRVLRTSTPATTVGDFRMRLCHETQELRVFAAVADTVGEASVVIEIPEHLRPAASKAVSGQRFTVYAGSVPGLPKGRSAVIVRLRDPEFEDLFAQLGSDLITGIQAAPTPASAVQLIARIIERWRRFLELRRCPLSAEEVRGLIGELAILERSISRLGAAAALAAWKAPEGSIRDFEFSDRTIEVKTMLASMGGSVRVNDPLQLQPEPNVSLLLVCQELGRSEAADGALSAHVARLAQRFAYDVKLADDFCDALAASGYMPSHAELYREGYSLGPLHAFLVGPDFPRIHPGTVPPGVVHVQFSLEILQLVRFRVDHDAAVGPVLPPPAPHP